MEDDHGGHAKTEGEIEDDHGDHQKQDDRSEENNSVVEEEEKEEIIPQVVQDHKKKEHGASDYQSPCFSSVAPNIQDRPKILSSQHHSFPSNNWGGASPLLSNNIPPESFEIGYKKLEKPEMVRSYDDLYVPPSPYVAADPLKEGEEIQELEKDPFLKLFMKLKENKWKIPKMDARSRWPQGWC